MLKWYYRRISFFSPICSLVKIVLFSVIIRLFFDWNEFWQPWQKSRMKYLRGYKIRFISKEMLYITKKVFYFVGIINVNSKLKTYKNVNNAMFCVAHIFLVLFVFGWLVWLTLCLVLNIPCISGLFIHDCPSGFL